MDVGPSVFIFHFIHSFYPCLFALGFEVILDFLSRLTGIFLFYKSPSSVLRTLTELLPFHGRLFLFDECKTFNIFVRILPKNFKSLPPSLFPLGLVILCVLSDLSLLCGNETFPGRLFKFFWRVFIQLYPEGKHFSVTNCSEFSMWHQLV